MVNVPEALLAYKGGPFLQKVDWSFKFVSEGGGRILTNKPTTRKHWNRGKREVCNMRRILTRPGPNDHEAGFEEEEEAEDYCQRNNNLELFIMYMYVQHTNANLLNIMTRQMAGDNQQESYHGHSNKGSAHPPQPPGLPTHDAAAMGIAPQPLCDAVQESREAKNAAVEMTAVAKSAAALHTFELETCQQALLEQETTTLLAMRNGDCSGPLQQALLTDKLAYVNSIRAALKMEPLPEGGPYTHVCWRLRRTSRILTSAARKRGRAYASAETASGRRTSVRVAVLLA